MAEKNIDAEINKIANQIRILHEEAYREYLGPVEILCANPDASENEVGLMLAYDLHGWEPAGSYREIDPACKGKCYGRQLVQDPAR